MALMGNQSGNECWEAEYEATNNLAESVCEVDGQVPLQAVTTAQTVPSPVDTPFFGDRVGWITINHGLVDGESLGGETLAVSKGKVCDSIYN